MAIYDLAACRHIYMYGTQKPKYLPGTLHIGLMCELAFIIESLYTADKDSEN
jgi:hypothetical protein